MQADIARLKDERMLQTMYAAPDHVASHRFARLAPKLASKSYRDSYVSMQLRIWLADQVRALRGDMTQAEFGKLIGKPQTVVSRLEDPDYGRLTIETLLEVASKLDIALLVRFVDHATFLMATNDFSESAIRPEAYNQASINALALALQPTGYGSLMLPASPPYWGYCDYGSLTLNGTEMQNLWQAAASWALP